MIAICIHRYESRKSCRYLRHGHHKIRFKSYFFSYFSNVYGGKIDKQKIEEEKREKYNIDNIFKNDKTHKKSHYND